MAGASSSRRRPRRVARADDEDNDNDEEAGPIVRKPTSTGSKQKSMLRMSFAPEQDGDPADKRSEIPNTIESLKPTKKQFPQTRDVHIASSEPLPLRAPRNDERPIYSKDYLAELRTSSSLRPRLLSDREELSGSNSTTQLQVADPQLATYDENTTLIPSAAEIAEKKERRARLAKEQDYISLEEDDNHDWRIARYKPEKDTRLVRDDEDFGEGFDTFVEDGTVALGRKAELAQGKRLRTEARELVDAAEDSSQDDSDIERNFAYEKAQTRAGMDGLAHYDDQRTTADRAPTTITPIPKLGVVIGRLRQRLLALEQKNALLAKEKEDLQQEGAEVAQREKEIQALVTEAGAKYERARQEAELEEDGPYRVEEPSPSVEPG